MQKKSSLNDADWITVSNGIPTGGFSTTYVGTVPGGDAGFYRVTWP